MKNETLLRPRPRVVAAQTRSTAMLERSDWDLMLIWRQSQQASLKTEELKVTLSLQSTRTINCHTLKPQKRGGVSLLKEERHEKMDVLMSVF